MVLDGQGCKREEKWHFEKACIRQIEKQAIKEIDKKKRKFEENKNI